MQNFVQEADAIKFQKRKIAKELENKINISFHTLLELIVINLLIPS
jgi:hypothetical protein